jgi:Bifunctional DNA primase/polymerase, N-terminal/Primase C terminal 1 (PriCT-1)
MSMVGAALGLAKRRMAVFPCKPREKRPATEHGCLDASTDAEVIRSWWRHEPAFNIGVATGQPSGVFVVDIDGIDAEQELRRLEAEHGALPSSVEVITPRPGRHIYFQMPDLPLRNSASKIAPGVDVRADGGFVISPPSIHPSGKRYAWSVDSTNTIAAAPAWLLDRIAEPGTARKPPAPASEWRTLITEGVPEGQRNSVLARIAGHLLRHRVDPIFAAGLVQSFNATRCLPPLPESEVTLIVDSICKRELQRRQANGG